MKKALVAVVAVAALGAATISKAQAQEDAVPFIAGAVIGTVIGVVIAKRQADEYEPPVAYEPPPRVVVVERPVVIRHVPPRHVHPPRHPGRHWRYAHSRRDWH